MPNKDIVEEDSSQIPAAEQALLAGAEHRIARGIWILGIAGIGVCWFWGGSRWGVGFTVGAVLSALNFHWMKGAVGTLADLASSQAVQEAAGEPPRQPKTARVVARFVLRFALIGGGGLCYIRKFFYQPGSFFRGAVSFFGGDTGGSPLSGLFSLPQSLIRRWNIKNFGLRRC